MSIVKNVVSLMNGTIDVKSTLGEGTTFTVIVQLKLQDRHHEDVEDLVDLRVLVADDELATCESAVDMLNSLGMKAEYVLSGDEACERVKTAHEQGLDYNVIILDWKCRVRVDLKQRVLFAVLCLKDCLSLFFLPTIGALLNKKRAR